MKIRVKNMLSNNYNPVPNQFEIWTNKGYYFQSYNSIIYFECKKTGKKYLDKYDWDYSRTTGKYLNKVLGENRKETRKGIKEGRYILKNLN
tara:strand:- start:1272 stop:1544 length:273 start_codon:yes stop_codon:yes gene_type:complete